MTPKQKEIYSELIKGKSYKQIAEDLYISESTVKTHCREIYRAHNVTNSKELIVYLLDQKVG